jgi:predicted phosphodiesterase
VTRVLVISDTHFPFQHKKALSKLIALAKKERPTHIVQVGDLLDQYGFSSYSKKLSINPAEEMRRGLEQAADMWRKLRKAFPKAKCYQLLGNHDIRLAKRLSEKLPELEGLVNPIEMYKFPGVVLSKSDRSVLVIDGVAYIHGHLSKSIDHAVALGMPVVHGHRHRMEIATKGKLWSMDVGFLGDERKVPFQYTQSTVTNWTLGSGIVENATPRLIFLGAK